MREIMLAESHEKSNPTYPRAQATLQKVIVLARVDLPIDTGNICQHPLARLHEH